jgi:hypothetical protein
MDIKNDFSTGLVAHWKLDETSGTREDIHSTYDLSDTNSVSYASGKFNNAADFTASSSEYLRNTTTLWNSTSMVWNLWMKHSTAPSSGGVRTFAHMGSQTGYKEFYLEAVESSGTVYASASYARPCVTGYGAQMPMSTVNIYDGNWHMITGVWEEAGDTLKLYVDGTLRTTRTSISGNGTCAVNDGITLGARYISGSGQGFADEVIDEVTFWGGWDPSTTDISNLWASGNGIEYEATSGATFTPRASFFM